MQINTTVNYDFIPTKMFITKKRIISVGEDVEKVDSLYNADTNVKWYSCCGKQFGLFSKGYM
jgi:hypothetical protein